MTFSRRRNNRINNAPIQSTSRRFTDNDECKNTATPSKFSNRDKAAAAGHEIHYSNISDWHFCYLLNHVTCDQKANCNQLPSWNFPTVWIVMLYIFWMLTLVSTFHSVQLCSWQIDKFCLIFALNCSPLLWGWFQVLLRHQDKRMQN